MAAMTASISNFNLHTLKGTIHRHFDLESLNCEVWSRLS